VPWRLCERPADASLVLLQGDRQVRRYQEGGVWSLFRLIDKGDAAPEADGATLVTFSDGEHVARLRLRVAGGAQPFERGGLWSFRCPSGL
jgi:type VI secretion system protein ImpL